MFSSTLYEYKYFSNIIHICVITSYDLLGTYFFNDNQRYHFCNGCVPFSLTFLSVSIYYLKYFLMIKTSLIKNDEYYVENGRYSMWYLNINYWI